MASPAESPMPVGTVSERGPGNESAAVEEPVDTAEVTVESIARLLTLVRADLATDFEQDHTPEQLLERVVHSATRLMSTAVDAGIALVSDSELRTIAAAGNIAVAVDDIQRALGRGPSMQVIAGGSTLRIDDVSADDRWPGFGAQAADVGARALLACSLPLARKGPGVFTLYADRPAAFDGAAELVVPVFAARAAIAIAYLDKLTNLQRAIENRQVIGQATGILMERHRLSPEQAFKTMITASQESHMKLRDVARRVTETGEEPGEAATRS